MGWIEKLKIKKSKKLMMAQMMSGQQPVFSQFGNDVYVSDIVQQCMACITDEMRKLQLNHIIKKDGKESIANSKLNRLFEYGVNEFMTTSDFLEKISYMLLKNMNVFIYPKFTYYENPSGEVKKREVEGLYPLDPKNVEFLQDDTGRLFVKFTFRNNMDFTLPYDAVIHWRMRFTENEYLGGNYYGKPEINDLLQTVQVNDSLIQGIEKGMKTSLNISGIMKYPITVDDEAIRKDIEEFENKLDQNTSGIMPIDARAEFIPTKIDPKFVDKDTLEFIDNRILRHWGCSLPVLNGTANPEQKQAFYEKAIEPRVISLAQAMTKVLFTSLEFSNGNRISAYPSDITFMTMEQKLSFSQFMGDRGALTNNQLLNIFGIAPYEGGDVRYMSLNYCDVEIANRYQLNRTGQEGGTNNAESAEE